MYFIKPLFVMCLTIFVTVAVQANEIEWGEKYKGGVCAVFNPVTQEVEWREKYKGGVAGVFNPVTQEVEWIEKYKGGVAGILVGQPDSQLCSSFAYDFE